jgi:hypothetical protein
VIIAEAQREGEIIRGEGDADAVRIFAEAVGRDVGFFTFYRSMQAYRDALADDNTSFVLSPDSEFFRYFDSPTLPSVEQASGPAEAAQPAAERAGNREHDRIGAGAGPSRRAPVCGRRRRDRGCGNPDVDPGDLEPERAR